MITGNITSSARSARELYFSQASRVSVITSLSHGDSNKFVNAPFQLMNRVLSITFTKSFHNGNSPSSVKTKDLRCLSKLWQKFQIHVF